MLVKRKDVIKKLRQIAKELGVHFELDEGGQHSKAMFNGKFVVTIPRHNEINELTAKGLLRDSKAWVEKTDETDTDEETSDGNEIQRNR